MLTRFLSTLLVPILYAVDEAAHTGAAVIEGTARKDRKRFTVDVQFQKALAATSGDLTLRGYANTWVQDRDLEFVLPTAFDGSLEDYLSKNPIVLYQHNHDWPIGQVTKAEVDDTGLYVEVVIPKPADGEAEWAHTAYQKIKSGVLRTFSIGGFFEREVRDRVLVITEVELFEISVVSVPSNPDSIFEAAVKSVRGEQSRVLSQGMVRQMEQLLGAKQVSDPYLASLDDTERRAHYDTLAALYREAGCEPPDRDAWQHVQELAKAGDPIGALQATMDFLSAVRGAEQPDVKKGRVLSKANEGALQQALEQLQAAGASIQQVLAKVAQAPEVQDDGELVTDDELAAPAQPAAPPTGAEAVLAQRRAQQAAAARAHPGLPAGVPVGASEAAARGVQPPPPAA